ncbi:hypothetical protein OGAPHI_006728 [Ogataea philodendri]|uniref:Thioredoxin domain-containing protein n=1 Tax=Ogataea philodendri TaxID=1378263 RepID=A0A9P8T0D6_9ASCO|nr:uncharacterized protein OGAPHI_006728 [Ogataea philodendri]KAH3661321.1 hypothetical protein OGAPHI_006728 [Ogataea philodendri]
MRFFITGLIQLIFFVLTNAEEQVVEDDFPEPLTGANFDQVVSKGVHFVEFFSPHCHHCKALAPIWHEFYQTFHKEAESYDVYIHQVDCVASGDLCDRENIFMYPSLRLYGPNDKGTSGKVLASFGRGYEKTVEGLTAFVREQAIDSKDELLQSNKEVTDLMKSVNIDAISSQEMIDVIAGNYNKPYLISFWPSTDEELNVNTFSGDVKENKLFGKCPRCMEFRNLWSMVGRRLSGLIQTGDLSVGYLNCQSNQGLCRSLGMEDLLTDDYSTYDPKIFMFLPSDKGGNKIRYKASVLNAKQVLGWTKRLIEVSKFEDITREDLDKKMKVANKPYRREDFAEVHVDPVISFVYLYPNESYVEEDFWLLNHLVQPIMDLPSNVRLYKSSDMKFMDLLESQENTLLEYVNKEIPDETQQLQFNDEMFTARTLTTYPTLLCFKDGSFVSHILKSFGPDDIRNFKAVSEFIKVNSEPFITQLTDSNRNQIFPKTIDPAIMAKNEKVVLMVTDSNDHGKLFRQGYALSQIGHRFWYMKMAEQFKKLTQLRGAKYAKVDKMKAKGKDNVDIIRALKEEVPPVFQIQDNAVHLVYVEKKTLASIANRFGWTYLHARDYNAGDVIIVSRFTNNYWTTSLKGKKLTCDTIPDVVDVLYASSFKKLSGRGLRSVFSFATVCSSLTIFVVFCLVVLSLGKLRLRMRLGFSSNKYRALSPFFSDPEANGGSGSGLGKVD